jgi:hypothetical protein
MNFSFSWYDIPQGGGGTPIEFGPLMVYAQNGSILYSFNPSTFSNEQVTITRPPFSAVNGAIQLNVQDVGVLTLFKVADQVTLPANIGFGFFSINNFEMMPFMFR